MQRDKKNIALVTTWFPPRESVAVNRMLAFAKYLDKSKYNLTVITLGEKGEPKEELLFGARVLRFENSMTFNFPVFSAKDGFIKHKLKVVKKLILIKLIKDPFKTWKKKALTVLKQAHTKNDFDVIISSYAPSAAHEVVLDSFSKVKKSKWIVDMRDEMSLNHSISKQNADYLHNLEQKMKSYVDALTTVSEPIVDYFKPIFSETNIFKEIRNGYDHSHAFDTPKNDVFTMTYTGSFYGVIKPTTFFKALVECKHLLPVGWRLKFVGTAKNFIVPNEFVENVEFIPRVPQSECLNYMAHSDLNLLIHPTVERKGIYTGKLFDYLSVKKPILGVIDTGDVAAKLIRSCNAGFVAGFEQHDEIVEAITKSINLWTKNVKLDLNLELIESLHRKYQVKKLETVIDSVLDEEI